MSLLLPLKVGLPVKLVFHQTLVEVGFAGLFLRALPFFVFLLLLGFFGCGIGGLINGLDQRGWRLGLLATFQVLFDGVGI